MQIKLYIIYIQLYIYRAVILYVFCNKVNKNQAVEICCIVCIASRELYENKVIERERELSVIIVYNLLCVFVIFVVVVNYKQSST